MLELIGSALLTGIVLSFGFGSVFFALIQSSLDYGFTKGVKMAAGVTVSDILLVFLALVGTSFLPQIPNFEKYFRIIGAILIIGLAIGQFKSFKLPEQVEGTKMMNFLYFFVKGFLLNILNPVNFLTWVAVSAGLKTYDISFERELLFFGIAIITIFVSESLIAYFSGRLKKVLNETLMLRIKQGTGLIFVCLAAKLLFDAFS
jgi:L-lysine exporter family protein LysE/ArgO